MNDLKVFSSSEFGELGVMLIDGKEYFPATQCAKLLGYKNPQEVIRDKCKGVRKMLTPSNGGNQQVNYIPEGDLYRLIVSSKLPAAEKFERWVFDEVLPSIRQKGSYGGIDIEKLITRTATAVASEIMKQIVPVILTDSRMSKRNTSSGKRKAKKCCVCQPLKMELLSPDIKEQADNMLASGEYSCQQVANFIVNTTGEYISQVAVNRYKRKFFEVSENQLSLFEEE